MFGTCITFSIYSFFRFSITLVAPILTKRGARARNESTSIPYYNEFLEDSAAKLNDGPISYVYIPLLVNMNE